MNSNVEILDDIDKVTVGARNDFYVDFSDSKKSIGNFHKYEYMT